MARRSARTPRRDWRQTVFLILSALIVLSMVLSLFATFTMQ
jgi:predicted nucleic acid-binding Zn ribbon protein